MEKRGIKIRESHFNESMSLNDLTTLVHQNAVAHGWWDEPRSFPEILALIHSEVSEALEEYRDGRATDDGYYTCGSGGKESDCEIGCSECEHSKPCGIPSELADVIIRILDYCGRAGIDIESAIMEKHAYNVGRPFRHGGKKC